MLTDDCFDAVTFVWEASLKMIYNLINVIKPQYFILDGSEPEPKKFLKKREQEENSLMERC